MTVFASTDTGLRDVFVLAELPLRSLLRLVARELDARRERWYIDVISSPTTIWRDMQGTRHTDRDEYLGDRVNTPEAFYLGQIGRRDLLRADG